MVSDTLSESLRRQISKFSTTGQTKMLELHGKFHYSDEDIDTFLLNHDLSNSLQERDIIRFQDYLEKEAKAKAARVPKPAPQKRRVSRSAALVADMLGPQGMDASKPQQAETPIPKKPRQVEEEAGSPSRLSPEPTPKPKVSRRTSVNEKLEKPQLGDVRVTVQLLGDSSLWTGRRDGVYEWMDESIEERSRSQDLRLAEVEGLMTAAMLERHSGEELVVGIVGVPAQAELILCGRLACEGLTGKLNERSILLEGAGSRDSSGGNSVRLNLGGCKSIVAVPGQIVAVVGRTGMTGTTFHARDFLPGLPIVPRALPRPPRPLHLMVAAGPFCLRDGLNYDPLKQLLDYALHEKPQVLVLMGPFLDAGNLRVAAGDTTIPGEEEPCSFEEVYTQHLLPLLEKGTLPLRAPAQGATPTEVLIVPSLEEVLCFHPLPQPPLDVSLDLPQGSMDQLRQLQVRFLPNPAHVSIDGVNMSFTASDVLSPVVRDIVLRPEGKKIEEAHRVMLGQRTLFPVVPREPAQVCEARAAALDFPGREVPDVCVFPSVTGVPTSTAVDETVFVNPGSLCRPAALGTFAEMWLVPPSAGEAAESTAFAERVRIDIQKLS